MVRFSCPHCGALATAHENGRGREVICQACNRRIVVPMEADPPPFPAKKADDLDFGQNDDIPERRPDSSLGMWSLIIAIVGIFLPFLGVFLEILAICLANSALAINRADGLAKAGKIVAWVLTLVWAIPMSCCVGFIVLGGSLGAIGSGSKDIPAKERRIDPAPRRIEPPGKVSRIKCAKCGHAFDVRTPSGDETVIEKCPNCGTQNRVRQTK